MFKESFSFSVHSVSLKQKIHQIWMPASGWATDLGATQRSVQTERCRHRNACFVGKPAEAPGKP